MTITNLKYEKLFPIGNFLNERIGFECSIEERENPMVVITKLRELAEQAHKEKYPHLYQEELESKIQYQFTTNESYNNNNVSRFVLDEVGLTEPYSKPSPKQLQIQLHIDTINSYTDKERLIKIYAPLVEKTPELKEAYQEKLKQLNHLK